MKYKIDVLKAMKDAGYSTYKLRKDKILGEATIQALRESRPVSYEQITRICKLLHCDIGDLLTVTDTI